MFKNFKRWLGGELLCTKCGKEFSLYTFGFGTGICPDCYVDETNFFKLDQSYWLNRLLLRIIRR